MLKLTIQINVQDVIKLSAIGVSVTADLIIVDCDIFLALQNIFKR